MTINVIFKKTIPIICLDGRFDAYEVPPVDTWLRENLNPQQPFVIFDLTQVTFVDTRALTLFVKWMKKAREHGGDLMLTHLDDAVRVIMELSRLDKALTIHPTVADALAVIEATRAFNHAETVGDIVTSDHNNANSHIITLTDRIDAFAVPALRDEIEALQTHPVQQFVVDLTEVTFLDSAGLAALVKLFKQARNADGDVVLVKSQHEDAHRILTLTKFDQVFHIVEDVTAATAYLTDEHSVR